LGRVAERQIINAYKILEGISEIKKPYGRYKLIWEDNVKMELK
jgi:hypothetical protein